MKFGTVVHFGTQRLMYSSNLYFSTILYGNLMWLQSTRHAGNYFVPISIRPILIFLLQKLCQITWLLTGWKNFLYFRRPPLRPEARGICYCHMVNPALCPVPKVTAPTQHSYFRPISITPVLTRALERMIVHDFIYPALQNPTTSLVFHDQFAFRPSGSTTAAIIS